MNRINIKSKNPILRSLSQAGFSDGSHLKNLGVMLCHHSEGDDYVILCNRPNGLNLSPRVAVDWIKQHIPKDLPIVEDIELGVVSQEMNGGDRKFTRRYSLFYGNIDEYFAKIDALKYDFEA